MDFLGKERPWCERQSRKGHRDSSLDGWPVYFHSLALPKLKENANFVKVTYFLTLPMIPTPLQPPPLLQPFPPLSFLPLGVYPLGTLSLCSSIFIPKQRPIQANRGGMVTGMVIVTQGIKGTCSVLPPLQAACFSSPQPLQEVKSTQSSNLVRRSFRN